jgi:hypothetical protein
MTYTAITGLPCKYGGETGIRTLGTRESTTVFETDAVYLTHCFI